MDAEIQIQIPLESGTQGPSHNLFTGGQKFYLFPLNHPALTRGLCKLVAYCIQHSIPKENSVSARRGTGSAYNFSE